MMARAQSELFSHAEIMMLAQEDTDENNSKVLEFLNKLASSFGSEEIFDMIAYVDTPDVLG